MALVLVWTDSEKVQSPRRGIHVWKDGGDVGESPYILLPISRAADGSLRIDGRSLEDFEQGGHVVSEWFHQIGRVLK